MRYVVDADILGILQRCRHLATVQALGRLPWIITDAVWYEVTDNAADNGASPATVTEMQKFLAAVATSPTVVEPQTAEARTLATLLAAPAKEGPGELSVIAYALHHGDAVPVLHDRAAVFRAVEELRGRVLSIHGLLAHLVKDCGLSMSRARDISGEYCKRYTPTRPPTWWSPHATS